MGGLFVPAQKSSDFSGTVRRLGAPAAPAGARRSSVVIAMSVVSVVLAILGPKLLGNATTMIFEGYVVLAAAGRGPGRRLVDGLHAEGKTDQAEHAGVDGHRPRAGRGLRRSSAGCSRSSRCSTCLGRCSAGPGLPDGRGHPATIYELREEVDGKIGRLPLSYFDTHPRGDLLSRVTNDIDNISTTLQQVLTQLITSRAHGDRRAGHDVLDVAAAGGDLAADGAAVVRRDDADRQALAEAVRRPVGVDRDAQRPRRADVHRPRPGQGVRPLARGRSRSSTSSTSGCTRRASGRSSSPGSSSRR